MDSSTLISITTVLENAESIVFEYVEELTALLKCKYQFYEIVLVDNGSTDHTDNVVKEILSTYKNIRFIKLSKKYDTQIALTAAIEASIGDYIVLMNINCDPVSLIPELISLSQQGNDLVVAMPRKNIIDPIWYQFFAKMFYKAINLLATSEAEIRSSIFICLSRQIANSIIQVKDRVRFIKFLSSEVGFSSKTITYDQIRRFQGKAKRQFFDKFLFAIETLISSSDRLVRIINVTCFLVSIVSFLYAIFVVLRKLFYADIAEGWSSISLILSLLFSILFFVLFIIGEYLSIVYKQTKSGPLYYISNEFNSSTLFEDIVKKNVT